MVKKLIILLLLPLFCFSQNKYQLYYTFDGTTLTDKSGLGIGTTYTNMTQSSGKVNGAYTSAAGNTARVTIANFAIDTTNGNIITVSFWYKPTASTATQTFFLNAWTITANYGILLQRQTSDTLFFRFANASGGSIQAFRDGYFNSYIDKWMMLTIVIKGSTSSAGWYKLYRNGDLFFASATNLNLMIGANASLYKRIGVLQTTGAYTSPLLGSIDNFILHNYGWSDSEVRLRWMYDMGMLGLWLPHYDYDQFNATKTIDSILSKYC